MKKRLLPVFLALMIAGMAGAAGAGSIDSGMGRIMESASPEQSISALVYLTEQVDLEAITANMDARNANLQERHEVVVRSLQDMAANTQGDIIIHLSGLKAQGKIKDYQAYWIANCIRIVAIQSEITKIAERPDVDRIYFDYPIESVTPVEQHEGPDGIITAEPGINAIRAPEAWALGIDGTGVLVANVDTGVDGNHSALASRWAGVADSRYAGHPGWAWYDPYLGQNNFPYDNGGHGTHTMGTICGGSPGSAIGVAPGSHWIAAGAIDRGGGIPRTVSDAILSFQWMLDPDGNPSTVWDVPAVCSNSWGVTTSMGYPPCDQLFWSYLDANEAAGTVIVFAAGNEGSSGLRRPADRATDAYRTLSVAAVDGNTSGWPIASFSSRGPTYCTPNGSAAIKPDIAAPGVSVRSSYPGGSYVYMSGTSMATPHIAGTVALIRQANPNLSASQVKQIMYDTAFDLGSAGEDNSYGWGMVDAYEAVLLAMGGTLPPAANFVGSPTSGCAPLTVNFTDQSTGDITSWAWTFGDGGTSTLQNPSHQYVSVGNYTVSLTATGPGGSNTNTKANYVATSGVPVANFTGTPTTGCAPLTVTFTNQSTGNPTSWSWTFGDGGTSTLQSPSHQYANAGTYTVSMTATNSCGSNTNTKTGYIVVNPPCNSRAYALSDMPVSGTITGSYLNTQASDNSYEVLREVLYNTRYSILEHKWNFNVTPGNVIKLYVEAYRPSNSDGDNFAFAYSTNNSTFTTALTVNSSTEKVYTATLPSNLSGTVYIRVLDTNRSRNKKNLDRVYIDHLYIETTSAIAGEPEFNDGLDRIDDEQIPGDFALVQNHPNPFNATTAISFTLPQAANVSLKIYNIAGQEVALLANEYREAGYHSITWDAGNFPSGIYFYRLSADNNVVTKRMTLLK